MLLKAGNPLLLTLLCLTSLVSADYYRFSLPHAKCDETREWDTDHLHSIINMVAGNQNVTYKETIGNGTVKGTSYTTDQDWKDITLTGNEPSLTVAFSMFNVGDDDTQTTVLTIISLVLQIPTRIPILGLAATAVNEFLSFFTDAYHCEGPVAVNAHVYSKSDLSSMAYNKSYCSTDVYSYQTGKGCVDVDPFTSKMSKYTVQSCLTRYPGSSDAAGGTPVSAAEPRWSNKSSFAFSILAVVTVMLFNGF